MQWLILSNLENQDIKDMNKIKISLIKIIVCLDERVKFILSGQKWIYLLNNKWSKDFRIKSVWIINNFGDLLKQNDSLFNFQ